MLGSGPSFAHVLFMHQFTPGPRTSQVNKAVSLVETVVATGKPLISIESEIERLMCVYSAASTYNFIADNLYVQAYHNKQACYKFHLGFCTIRFVAIRGIPVVDVSVNQEI